MECWAEIVGFPDYLVSDHGRVMRTKTGLILKPSLVGNGYPGVVLYVNVIPYSVRVHQLVARTFVANPRNLREINHIDGCKINNKATNLEWTTHSKNLRHASATGLRARKFSSIMIMETGERFLTIADCADHLDSNTRAVWAAINRGTPHRGVNIRYVY